MNIVNINNNKFKTNIIAIFLSTKLDKENVAKNALLPAVLRRGSKDRTAVTFRKKRLTLLGVILNIVCISKTKEKNSNVR